MHRSLLGVVTASLLLAPAASYQAKEETATCTRVIDGDTIEISVAGYVEKVRLISVDTPETVDPRKPVQFFGKEASEFTRHLVEGKHVVLRDELGGHDRDKYARLLRYVYLEEGTFVNAEIVKQGYGHAYLVFPFSHMEEFRTYERQAREKGLGLWGSTEVKSEPGQARAPTEGRFVGSSQSNKYHLPDCVWARKISPANLVTFKSPEEAQRRGYVPCKVCNPPAASQVAVPSDRSDEGATVRYYVQSPNVASTTYDGQAVLVNPQTAQVHLLNQVGSFIWNLCVQPKHREELVVAVLDAYDTTRDQAGEDVDEFISALREKGLVAITNAGADP